MGYETPKIPIKLPGTFWGIVTIFNPARFETKLRNYRKFRESLKRQGLDLLTVELAFGDLPFELEPGDAEKLIQIRGGEPNTLLHKEALLNVGLAALPDDCDKVAWLDCDIIFENDEWVEETAKLLQEYAVVQPFSHVVRLPRGGRIQDFKNAPFGNSDGQKMHSMGYGVAICGRESLKSFMEHGHCGFAWAARRAVFEGIGFYDRAILGSADLLMAHAFYGSEHYYLRTRFSKAMLAHQDVWNTAIFERVKGSVYYAPGTVYHLWHGSQERRYYNERHILLKKYDFDPMKDIRLNGLGYFEWSTKKRGLRESVEEYFFIRDEDGVGPDSPAPFSLDSERVPLPQKPSVFRRIPRIRWKNIRRKLNVLEWTDWTFGQAGLFLRRVSPALYRKLGGKNEV